MPDSTAPRSRVATALAIVYLVWGTSFIATKVMVTDVPPLAAAGLRFTCAGLLLTAFAWWRHGAPRLDRMELRHVALMAFLSVAFSNACHVVAMQYVQSNTAALLNATPALWIAWLGTFGPRRRPLTGTQQAGLAIGLAGVLLILSPKGGFHLAGLGWQLLILLGCLSWSLGTIYHRNAAAVNRVANEPDASRLDARLREERERPNDVGVLAEHCAGIATTIQPPVERGTPRVVQ